MLDRLAIQKAWAEETAYKVVKDVIRSTSTRLNKYKYAGIQPIHGCVIIHGPDWFNYRVQELVEKGTIMVDINMKEVVDE